MYTSSVYAQETQSPVNWRFSAKKIDELTFELHIKASIKSPWHIYAQSIPEGTAIPTSIQIEKNPLVIPVGKCSEIGKLEEKVEENMLLKYYSIQVDFVQVVKLKAAIKTTITGSVTFMACTNERCLPPAEKAFAILIDGRREAGK